MAQATINVLCIGDIFGKIGRQALKTRLAGLKTELHIDYVIANGENAAGGLGITPRIARELLQAGVDVLTTGNHVWRKRELLPFIDTNDRLIRPLNFPCNNPGSGYAQSRLANGIPVIVINLVGRIFMDPVDCPFTVVDTFLEQPCCRDAVIIVDFHAEATSEKIAMGWFLDGRVSAVFGTHTHVQTADERILPNGTGYITDVGMTGPANSVIGVRKDRIITRFLSGMPTRFEVAAGDSQFNAIYFEIDPNSFKTIKIARIMTYANGLE